MTDNDRAFELVKIGVEFNAGRITAEQAADSALGAIAAIRAECADRVVVLYCADNCGLTALWNEECRAGGGCKEMHKYRAAIEGGQNA